MSVFTIIAVVLGAAIAIAAITQGPALIALGIARALWSVAQSRGERLSAVLVTPRQAPADPWAATSKEDRQLLSRSLASAMNRTMMRSLLPSAF